MKFIKKNLLIIALLTVSSFAFGKAAYIQAKAQVAQYLLQDAWEKTLIDQKPHQPWSWADTFPIAKLSIPTTNIERLVLSGASGRNLAFGPGLLLSSDSPERKGYTIIGGHRDTHFEFLQDLIIGQKIEIEDKYGEKHSYQITATEVHNIETDSIIDRGADQLTLVTCYPFNTIETGGPLRYLVHAKKLTT
ncbi:class GN sortase [Kangiella sp. HZ709]|uniref:class GN sortase n=1 Tax=Kangiella sp. HZ709 TaxID=2666328 RepID=UPI0012B03704|nr:class GN sortase [Kangiella sp. HZ709]MRX28093.1 class GN sortase [Kangiella sp. HZ709]